MAAPSPSHSLGTVSRPVVVSMRLPGGAGLAAAFQSLFDSRCQIFFSRSAPPNTLKHAKVVGVAAPK